MSVLRQLARSPTKSMSGTNQQLYSTVEKAVESWRQSRPSKQLNGHNNETTAADNNHNGHQNGSNGNNNGNDSSTSSSSSQNGKLKAAGGEQPKEVNAAVGGSVVVLD